MAARETDSPGLEALEESIGQDEAAIRERHDALVADPKAAVEMAAKAELRSKQIREVPSGDDWQTREHLAAARLMHPTRPQTAFGNSLPCTMLPAKAAECCI